MKHSLFLGAVLLFAPYTTFALDVPRQASADSRVRIVNYNEDDVVALYAKRTTASHIVFAPGEEILDIASGFSAGWEFKARRNHLYFKPRSAQATGEVAGLIPPAPGKWDTNLLVTTNFRVYTFQLALVGDNDTRNAYRVSFRYPASDAAAVADAREAAEMTNRLAAAPVVRNERYTMQIGRRSRAITPQRAYDDGRFTYLSFGDNKELPAVFMLSGQDRTETLVNTHMVDGQLVIQQLAPEFVLRLGRQVVHVFNEAFDAEAEIPGDTGAATNVQGVDRVLKGGE